MTKLKIPKAIIAFRPDTDTMAEFGRTIANLGVTASDFARRAYELGKAAAFDQIAKEKKADAESILRRLKSVTPPKVKLAEKI